jgi:ketosteroid isomerase-like protein
MRRLLAAGAVARRARSRSDACPTTQTALDNACAVMRDNVELANRAYEAVNRRDLDAFLGLMDHDVELLAAMEGTYHGHDGIRRWWNNLHDAIPDFVIEVGEARNLGEVTVTALRFRGRGAESDTPFEQLRWNAARWRRGKCIWWRTLSTEREALDAVRPSR